MKISVKQISYTALLLAIAAASMFLKNANVFISGSIVNTCLILITLFAGIPCSVISAIITPILSCIITGKIPGGLPIIIPMIMIGNLILCIFIGIFDKNPEKKNSIMMIIPMIIGSILKALFMGVIIGLIIVPAFIPESKGAMIKTIQYTFSVVQLVTAIIASFISVILYKILCRYGKS